MRRLCLSIESKLQSIEIFVTDSIWIQSDRRVYSIFNASIKLGFNLFIRLKYQRITFVLVAFIYQFVVWIIHPTAQCSLSTKVSSVLNH